MPLAERLKRTQEQFVIATMRCDVVRDGSGHSTSALIMASLAVGLIRQLRGTPTLPCIGRIPLAPGLSLTPALIGLAIECSACRQMCSAMGARQLRHDVVFSVGEQRVSDS